MTNIVDDPDFIKELEAIDKKYGAGTVWIHKNKPLEKIEVIPTGSLGIDYATGIGGIPRGRMIELIGKEMSSKTTLCLQIIAQIQKQGGLAAFIDGENSLDPDYATNLGVDMDNLIICQENTAEIALNVIDDLIRTNKLSLIVLDSVASMVPKAELDGEIGDSHMALQARLMAQTCRGIKSILKKSNCAFVYTNQLRANPAAFGYGKKEITAGGNALKYYTDMRIEMKIIQSQIKVGESPIGSQIRASIIKNKLAPPYKTCEFLVVFGQGISIETEIIDIGTEYSILTKSGAWFKYNGENIAQGRDSLRQKLMQNTKLKEELLTKIKAKLYNNKVVQQENNESNTNDSE